MGLCRRFSPLTLVGVQIPNRGLDRDLKKINERLHAEKNEKSGPHGRMGK